MIFSVASVISCSINIAPGRPSAGPRCGVGGAGASPRFLRAENGDRPRAGEKSGHPRMLNVSAKTRGPEWAAPRKRPAYFTIFWWPIPDLFSRERAMRNPLRFCPQTLGRIRQTFCPPAAKNLSRARRVLSFPRKQESRGTWCASLDSRLRGNDGRLRGDDWCPRSPICPRWPHTPLRPRWPRSPQSPRSSCQCTPLLLSLHYSTTPLPAPALTVQIVIPAKAGIQSPFLVPCQS